MIDTIKAVFTYVTALTIVVGGLLILYLTRADPTASELRLLIGGFIGSALTFLFSAEVQTRTARQSAASTAAAASSMPTMTATATPPSVTATPSEPPGPIEGG